MLAHANFRRNLKLVAKAALISYEHLPLYLVKEMTLFDSVAFAICIDPEDADMLALYDSMLNAYDWGLIPFSFAVDWYHKV